MPQTHYHPIHGGLLRLISHVLALEWSLHPKMLFSVCVPPVAASLCSKQNACSEMETNFLFLQFPLQHLQKSQTAISQTAIIVFCFI